MAEVTKSVSFSSAERALVIGSIEVYKAVVKRRLNAESNSTIKEILQAQFRELDALAARI